MLHLEVGEARLEAFAVGAGCHRAYHKPQPCFAMELSQDVLTMIIDGVDANLQSISYLLAGLPLADEQQYLAFAVGEQSFEWGD